MPPITDNNNPDRSGPNARRNQFRDILYEQFRNPNLNLNEQAMLANAPAAKEGHMQIALVRTAAQFAGMPIMPEDENLFFRYPHLDPIGKYSVIDLKFAQRESVIRDTLQVRDAGVQRYVLDLLSSSLELSADGNNPPLFHVRQKMVNQARLHRNYSRASKLCLDKEGRDELYQRARDLEACQEVVQCDMLFQGLEYAAGVRSGPVPEEVQAFYRDRLHTPLDLKMVEKAQKINSDAKTMNVKFENLDNRALQLTWARPESWNQSMEQIQEAAKENVNYLATTLLPYHTATAKQVLDPLFDGPEQTSNGLASRGDLIIVDGRTVREIMQLRYDASSKEKSFADYYKDNVKQMSSELVATALMAGKRVEAFLPDARGGIPKEPVHLHRTGYEPSPLEPEKFNIWQRYFAKRGFYKEKVSRQQEYERAMAARERVRTNHRTALLKELPALDERYSATMQKDLFFSPVMEERDFMKLELDEGAGLLTDRSDWSQLSSYLKRRGADGAFVNIARTEAVSTCICYLAAQGHKFQDIMDPNKLQAERLAAARMFVQRGETSDQAWLGHVFYQGHKALLRQVEELVQGVDLRDETQLLPVLPELHGMTNACFSVSQMLAAQGCRAAYLAEGVAETQGGVELGCQKACALDEGLNNLASFFLGMQNGMLAQSKLVTSAAAPGAQPLTDSDMRAIALQSVLASQIKEGRSTAEKVPGYIQTMDMKVGLLRADTLEQIRGELNRPENQAQTKQLAASGALTKALTFKHQTIEARNPDGEASMLAETTYTLKTNEEGKSVLEEVRTPKQIIDHAFEFQFKLPALDRQAPQRQEPQRQPPHRTPPQTGRTI